MIVFLAWFMLVVSLLAVILVSFVIGLPKTGKWNTTDLIRSLFELVLAVAVCGRVLSWW